MQDLVIFGSKYRDVIKLVDAINRARPTWRLLGFVDDREECQGMQVHGVPVLGTRELLPGLAREGASFFNNVSGSTAAAQSVARLLEPLARPVASLIHPAIDLAYTELGRGAILAEGCCVGGGSVIGCYLVARLHCVISHDVRIGDHVFLGAGATIASGAVLEDGAFIGAGATIKPGCRVGAGSIVGSGALVAEDVPPGVTLSGVRGRVVSGGGRT